MDPRFEKPRPPVVIDRAYADPDGVRALVRRGGPYWPTLRYVASTTELAAYGGEAKKMTVVPWFRSDWAYGEVRVEGAEEILHNRAFVEAAHESGIDVHFWTINDESTMHQLIDLDADGIMTDRPHRLRSVLVERGRWEDDDE